MSRSLRFPSAACVRDGSAALRRSGPAVADTTNDWLRTCCIGIGVGWFAVAQVVGLGCREEAPPATLEGTLRLDGKPLDNCLVTFLPESRHEANLSYSVGLTDQHGVFHLRTSNQQEGVALGRHRVTIQDLSISTGVSRRDHGTVDQETETVAPPPPIRRSRVAPGFMFPESTPLRQDVRPGHQVVALDVEGPGVGGRKGG